MKTVGEFKRAGGKLTLGDKVSPNGDWDLKDEDLIKSFAWRTNTGVKPEFKGVIQVQYRDGESEVWEHPNNIPRWFNYDCANGNCYDDDIIKWRPHLPSIQTETPEEKAALDKIDAHVSDASKPVYTQAMCDAGERPSVGVRCLATARAGLTAGLHSWAPVTVMYSSGLTIVTADDSGAEYVFNLATGQDVMFKPIQTEREKAIEIVNIICSEQGFNVDGSEVVLALDNAGLLK